jgi:hypothetical protein
MDQKAVDRLEREIEQAIAGVVARLGLKKLPLLPSQKTMRMMAKAAVAVYEAAVDGTGDQTPHQSAEENKP